MTVESVGGPYGARLNMNVLISIRCCRSPALAVLAGALAAGGAHAGGLAVGKPVVAVPVHAPQHRGHAHRVTSPFHRGSPVLGGTIIRPVVPPPLFGPIVPGFVTFVPPVVIVTPVAVPVHHPQPVPLPAPIFVQPEVPVIPPSPLFFAPPVQAVAPFAGGQVLIIRRTGH
jgi:hypothetical protein